MNRKEQKGTVKNRNKHERTERIRKEQTGTGKNRQEQERTEMNRKEQKGTGKNRKEQERTERNRKEEQKRTGKNRKEQEGTQISQRHPYVHCPLYIVLVHCTVYMFQWISPPLHCYYSKFFTLNQEKKYRFQGLNSPSHFWLRNSLYLDWNYA